MAIKDWLPEDRPREKLLQRGAEALTDAELLASSPHRATRNAG
jgi:DNA repair protein RadC